MKATFLFFLIMFFVLILQAQQNTFPVLAMEAHTTALNIDTTAMNVMDSILFKTEMRITITDTANLTGLQVKLRKKNNGSDLLIKNFTYDSFGTFSDSTSYNRNGFFIDLGLGSYYGLSTFYTELIVTRSNATVSDPVIFSR
jgi:hypothetical protein